MLSKHSGLQQTFAKASGLRQQAGAAVLKAGETTPLFSPLHFPASALLFLIRYRADPPVVQGSDSSSRTILFGSESTGQ